MTYTKQRRAKNGRIYDGGQAPLKQTENDETVITYVISVVTNTVV